MVHVISFVFSLLSLIIALSLSVVAMKTIWKLFFDGLRIAFISICVFLFFYIFLHQFNTSIKDDDSMLKQFTSDIVRKINNLLNSTWSCLSNNTSSLWKIEYAINIAKKYISNYFNK